MSEQGGIIFDMDNTLLRSSISFAAMKRDVYQYAQTRGVWEEELVLDQYTASTLLTQISQSGRLDKREMAEIWEIVVTHEVDGMHQAPLEDGAVELLARLSGKYILTIVTNNAYAAAERALGDNKILSYFNKVIARDHVREMKPAPDSVHAILAAYPQLSSKDWLSVGDAWIDGAAAQSAGVDFVAYRSDPALLRQHGITPIARLQHLDELMTVLEERRYSL